MSIITGALFGPFARAEESSRYYFDHGAEQFTRDDVEKARAWVDEGLVLYPQDEKLIALKQLLEQQQQQQQQENQSSGNEQDQQEPNEGEQDGQPEPQPGEQGDSGEPQDPPEQEKPASAMTPEEAERILDAMRDRESAERARVAEERLRREARRLPPVEKDW
ncbi:MAG TPA: hypothetical protein PKE12_05700 [Kiritimatiellia bacterium]|nr:hypothetical protein [Kiritimatiellia bacterium]